MVAQEHHQVSGLMLAQWTLVLGGSQGLMNWPATCEPTLDRNHSSAVYAWGTFPAQTIWQLTSVLTLEKSHLPATHVVDDLHDPMNAVATWRSIWENKLRKRRRPEKLWLLSLMELFHLFRAGLLNQRHHHSRSQWPQWTLFKVFAKNTAVLALLKTLLKTLQYWGTLNMLNTQWFQEHLCILL